MPPTLPIQHGGCQDVSRHRTVKRLLLDSIRILSIPAIILFLCVALGLAAVTTGYGQSSLATLNHTSPTTDPSCTQAYHSNDGNPFQLCPGPFPRGGNCVWWAWEQWHLLGYDLPLNWGNAADWIVDAQRAGLPIGTSPRVGAIAVFPRADGYWAYTTAGHVAFVTSVSADGSSFNVTYQSYGDSVPIHIGLNYSVNQINEPGFQQNELRFIYFPRPINTSLFARLPGVGTNNLASVMLANSQLATTGGLTLGSGEQEFSANFTGNGLSNLLLYNREQGSLSVVSLSQQKHLSSSPKSIARRVFLSDAQTSATGWGSTLDVQVGNFVGTGKSDILLYDRTNGRMQLLTLTPQLTIKKHVWLSGWGSGWEVYTGQFDGQRSGILLYNRFANASIPSLTTSAVQSSTTTLDQWSMSGRTATAIVLNFNPDLSIRYQQRYTLWHNSWEVYVGHYKNTSQDGLFLYDRSVGEARIMDFDSTLTINDYQELHNLNGNWQIFSGDFNGSGRAQVALYDPDQGRASFLVFSSHLALTQQVNYTGWATNQVFYVGHFGTDRLNAMLYDPQKGTSTFLLFNNDLTILNRYTVQSWNQDRQILIGPFTNHSVCIANGTCAKGDDILILNRKTGQMQQYIFTFGRQYQVGNNDERSFASNGAAPNYSLETRDTTSFRKVGTFGTTISDEELY